MKNFTSRYSGFLTLVLAATIFSGCVMKAYSGPDLPEDKIAIIVTDFFSPKGFLSSITYATRVILIDGEPATGRAIHVKPGFHTIEFSASIIDKSGFFSLTKRTTYIRELRFEARANHAYLVRATEESGMLYTWVDESRTDIFYGRAGGVRDSQDNDENIRTVAGEKPQ